MVEFNFLCFIFALFFCLQTQSYQITDQCLEQAPVTNTLPEAYGTCISNTANQEIAVNGPPKDYTVKSNCALNFWVTDLSKYIIKKDEYITFTVQSLITPAPCNGSIPTIASYTSFDKCPNLTNYDQTDAGYFNFSDKSIPFEFGLYPFEIEKEVTQYIYSAIESYTCLPSFSYAITAKLQNVYGFTNNEAHKIFPTINAFNQFKNYFKVDLTQYVDIGPGAVLSGLSAYFYIPITSFNPYIIHVGDGFYPTYTNYTKSLQWDKSETSVVFNTQNNGQTIYFLFKNYSDPTIPITLTIEFLYDCPMNCTNRGECSKENGICSCDNGFYGNGCESIAVCKAYASEGCPIVDGSGSRKCLGAPGKKTSWGPCEVVSCDPGYYSSANTNSCIIGTPDNGSNPVPAIIGTLIAVIVVGGGSAAAFIHWKRKSSRNSEKQSLVDGQQPDIFF